MDLHELAQFVDRGLTILMWALNAGLVIYIAVVFWIEFRNPPSPEEIRALEDGIARSRQIRREGLEEAIRRWGP